MILDPRKPIIEQNFGILEPGTDKHDPGYVRFCRGTGAPHGAGFSHFLAAQSTQNHD
jgi:hypothetical protein